MKSKPSEDFVRKAKIIKVVDGDTLRLSIDLGFTARITHDIRLAGLNTPEPYGWSSRAGKYVTSRVVEFIGSEEECTIHSKQFEVGKFGRCICEVWIGDRCLNDYLLDNKLAWTSDDNGVSSSLDLNKLTGIPERIRNGWGQVPE